MKIVAYILAIVVGAVGLIFLVAAPTDPGKTWPRLGIGGVCFVAALVIVALMRMRPQHVTHVQKMKVDLTGDVSLEKIMCQQCGGEFSSDSVNVVAGAVFVKCEYCGAQYQLEEEPKW